MLAIAAWDAAILTASRFRACTGIHRDWQAHIVAYRDAICADLTSRASGTFATSALFLSYPSVRFQPRSDRRSEYKQVGGLKNLSDDFELVIYTGYVSWSLH